MTSIESQEEIQLPGKLKTLVDHLINVAVSNVETESQIMPVVVLHSSEKNEGHYVALDFKDDQSKIKSFHTAKSIANEVKADTSVFITEAYVRRCSEGETAEEVYENNGGSLENDSKAVECLMVCVETPSGNYLAQAPIVTGATTKRGRSCQRPKFYAMGLEERMVGFIERQVIQ